MRLSPPILRRMFPLCSTLRMAQNATHHPAPNLSAAVLVAELARQRRLTNALSFEVEDLREVHISGPVDLVALARAAAEIR